jgi:hypothetical protein
MEIESLLEKVDSDIYRFSRIVVDCRGAGIKYLAVFALAIDINEGALVIHVS